MAMADAWVLLVSTGGSRVLVWVSRDLTWVSRDFTQV